MATPPLTTTTPSTTAPTKEEADMTQSLAQDRPTIDAAIKSYISLVCAKVLTASATDDGTLSSTSSVPMATTNTTTLTESSKTLLGLIPSSGLVNTSNSNSKSVQQQVLQLARIILQTLNQFTFPIHCTVMADSMMVKKPGASKQHLLELSIAAQLWNGLVQSKQKPSRFLGRRALKHAWKNQLKGEIFTKLMEGNNNDTNKDHDKDDNDNDGSSDAIHQHHQQQQLHWFQEFERLLFYDENTIDNDNDNNNPNANADNDAALIWAADGGAQELAKRRTRRQEEATKRGDSSNIATTTSDTTMMDTISE
ncbi:unnamed protein product [Cylindrotheca closterium]|uniref:Uncharacterized protein n=1 Tax=Cylindrotheca closterium TaxID=2856 RepID=A0AAD2JMI3_9STRA|nr:unnamed protein product [Cylindrotheca closterium]